MSGWLEGCGLLLAHIVVSRPDGRWTEKMTLRLEGPCTEAVLTLGPDQHLTLLGGTITPTGGRSRRAVPERLGDGGVLEDGSQRVVIHLEDLAQGGRAELRLKRRSWTPDAVVIPWPGGAQGLLEVKAPPALPVHPDGLEEDGRFWWTSKPGGSLRVGADIAAPPPLPLPPGGLTPEEALARLATLRWLERGFDGPLSLVGPQAVERGAVDDRGFARTLVALTAGGSRPAVLARWAATADEAPAAGAPEVVLVLGAEPPADAAAPAGGPELGLDAAPPAAPEPRPDAAPPASAPGPDAAPPAAPEPVDLPLARPNHRVLVHPGQTLPPGFLHAEGVVVPWEGTTGAAARPAETTWSARLLPTRGDPLTALARGRLQLQVTGTFTRPSVEVGALPVRFDLPAEAGAVEVHESSPERLPGSLRRAGRRLWAVARPEAERLVVTWVQPVHDAWGTLPAAPGPVVRTMSGEDVHLDGDGTWRIASFPQTPVLDSRARLLAELERRQLAASYPEPAAPGWLRRLPIEPATVTAAMEALAERAVIADLDQPPDRPRHLVQARRSGVVTEHEAALILRAYLEQLGMPTEVELRCDPEPHITPVSCHHAALRVRVAGEELWVEPGSQQP